jgi:hypothetical protein
MFLCISSENLRIFIDFTVRTVAKRIDEATETLAEFLNTSVFGLHGPDPNISQYLYVPGQTGSVIAAHIPAGYIGRVIPKNLKEAKNFPLVKADPVFLLVLGCLRSFDSSVNNAIPSQHPQCNFTIPVGSQVVKGLQKLDMYGPMFFEIMYSIASGLGGEFLKVCSVSRPEHVPELLKMNVSR